MELEDAAMVDETARRAMDEGERWKKDLTCGPHMSARACGCARSDWSERPCGSTSQRERRRARVRTGVKGKAKRAGLNRRVNGLKE